MALTIAHPTIAPVFRRLVRGGVVDLPALLVGTVVPDLGEWINRDALAARAHTWPGLVTTVLPTGLVMFFVYHLLRRPVFFALPNPHRRYLADSEVFSDPPLYPAGIASIFVGILLGSCCHLAWDAVTEVEGHFVQTIPALRTAFMLPVWSPIQGTIPRFVLLNAASSGLGLAFAAVAYWRWCFTRSRLLPHPYAARDFDLWRWYFWAVAVLVSAAQALPGALPLLGRDPDIYRFSLFCHHWVTSFVSAFVPFVAVGSIFIYFVWGIRSRRSSTLDKK